MHVSTITAKQREILKLLYRHRFLERNHIQRYFGHIDRRRSARWLKDLKEKQLVGWIYDQADPYDRSKPALFFLAPDGIRLLRGLGGLAEQELRKRYKDATRQPDFIDQCLLLADCCVHLETKNKTNAGRLHYGYALKADYSDPGSEFYHFNTSELIHPDLVFTKQVGPEDAPAAQAYIMQLLSPNTTRYMVKKQLRAYIGYLQSSEWEGLPGGGNLPVILIACPTVAGLIYAKRFVQRQLAEAYDDDIPGDGAIRFTTLEKLRSNGLTAVIWEDS